MKTFDFVTFDNEILKCYLFLPDKPLLGMVQVIHGLEEHALRYKNLAKYLNSFGFGFFASDQRLHGMTAYPKLGVTKIKDVFPVMVKDQMLMSDLIIEKYRVPLIVLGHSYGSFITQSYIENYHKHDGVILSGSAYMKRADTLLAKKLSYFVAKFKSGEQEANMIEKLVLKNFDSNYKDGSSWISQNEENVKEYKSDPLCGHPLCANFYYSMFKNVRQLYKKKYLDKIDKHIPILIISGKDDPVGKMGKSTTKLYRTYAHMSIDVKLKLYNNARHEILNENIPKVKEDLKIFLENIVEKNNQ